MDEIDKVKPVIRSILLALGKRATEKSFRSEYCSQEGESFNKVLFGCKMSFYQFMKGVPDVCRVWDNGEEIFLEHVSTETSCHMDNLTINTRKRLRTKPIPAKYRPNYGSYRRPAGIRVNPSLPFAAYRQFNYGYLYQTMNFNHLPPPAPTGYQSYKPNPIISSNKFIQPYQNSAVSSQKCSVPHQKHSISAQRIIDTSQKTADPPQKSTIPQQFAKSTSRKVSPLPVLPLRHQNWPSVKIDPNFDNEKTEIEDAKPPADTAKKNSIGSPSSTSSGWSEESFKKIQPSRNPFAAYLKTKLDAFPVKKVEKVSNVDAPPSVEKSETEDSANSTVVIVSKVEKFKESEVAQVLMQKKIEKPEGNTNKYITGKHLIPQARMRQLKFVIYVQIQVIDVRSISYFIFNFNCNELNTLLDEMNIHYKTLEESEHLRVKSVFPEMSVAAFDDGQWQRAQTLMVSREKVLIRFIDTMKVKYVNRKDLRYLEKTFAISPRKACPGTLAGVEPKGDAKSFTPEVVKEFSEKVKDVKIYAVVKGKENGIFKLALFSDSMKRKKISDELIVKGLVDKNNYEDMSVNAILF